MKFDGRMTDNLKAQKKEKVTAGSEFEKMLKVLQAVF